MNRRDFLLGAAATPLVFGLSDLFAQEPHSPSHGDIARLAGFGGQDAPAKPKWLDEAFKRMKETARPGLVLIAPGAVAERRAFGQDVLELAQSKDADVRELFVECAVVCLAPDVAAKHVDAKGNRVMLDADGKVLASDTVAFDETFASSCREFLHGKDGARLRASVKRVQEGLKDGERMPIETALDKIDADGGEPAESIAELKRVADRIAPWLVLARLEAVHKAGRERLRGVLASIAVRDLPYGAALPKFVSCCGHWTETEDPDNTPVPACGMARANRDGRKFVKFLTE